MGAVSEAAKEKKRLYNAQWAIENRDKRRVIERRYRLSHPEKVQELESRPARRQYIRDWQKRKRESQPDVVRAAFRDWYERNPEYNRKRQRVWRAANPEAMQAQSNRRRAHKLAAPGDGVTRQQWKEIVDSYLGRCVYCGEPWVEMDHLTALSMGGAHDEMNVAPACSACNASKNNTTLIVWLVRRSHARGRIHQ